jgi:hypothetical protein
MDSEIVMKLYSLMNYVLIFVYLHSSYAYIANVWN